jgi:tetratricopeptide (TPR) repeat protein
MTRALLVVALLAHVAAADPKREPDKFAKAAGDAFKAAVAADKDGDLRTALGLYEKAFAISPHPSTIYNIADVQRRLNQLPLAIKAYETYLAITPTASDKKEVEAMIDKLQKTPGLLWVVTSAASDPNSLDLQGAYVLVDGEIKKQPGVEVHTGPYPGWKEGVGIDMRAGEHTIDVITPVTFGSKTCRFGPGEHEQCEVTAPPRTDGAIVYSASTRDLRVRIEPKGRKDMQSARFDLGAGKLRLQLRDRSFECPTIPIEVVKGGDVAYVFVATTEHDQLERCRTTSVTQHRLHFAP